MADEVHAFLTSGRSVGIFRVRSPHVWNSRSEVDKCAACSTISMELILINVDFGKFKANSNEPWREASTSFEKYSGLFIHDVILPFSYKRNR